MALHAAALAGVLARPRHWRWAAGAVVLDQALLTGAGMLPRSRWLGPNLSRLEDPGRAVALTFDDGPDPEVTPRVLDMLDEAGMRASFFCIGARARAQAALVGEIARRGHTVENHSMNHLYRFAALGPRALAREVMTAQAILADCTGAPPVWFRAPMGLRSPLLQPVLESAGLRLASWSRRALDGVSGDQGAAVRRLTRGLAAGDVLLMHDGNCARDREGRPVVLSAMPPLLLRLRQSGLLGRALPRAA
ncbi:polysaccharide deacetylase family protein [Lichenicoccus sp.]|uniref:polysaccharide deacetylase family protein n=1 Tax=Lichenicoccus sp. TaxID=2781899 RepID=UPI003D14F6FA